MKRVEVVDYEAREFVGVILPSYTEAVVSKPYEGGVDFSTSKQRSDFAPVGNPDTLRGYPEVGVYTQGMITRLRGGTGVSEASSTEQNTKFKTMLGSATWHHLYELAEPQTIALPSVTLPTLPSPNITVYHDSDVPSDITVEYVQDINIVLDNLNAKIAALNIAQTISS